MEGMRGNQIVLCAVLEGGEEITEKKEETEKRPLEEGVQRQERKDSVIR